MNILSRQLSRQTEYYNHSVVEIPIIVIAFSRQDIAILIWPLTAIQGPKSISESASLTICGFVDRKLFYLDLHFCASAKEPIQLIPKFQFQELSAG